MHQLTIDLSVHLIISIEYVLVTWGNFAFLHKITNYFYLTTLPFSLSASLCIPYKSFTTIKKKTKSYTIWSRELAYFCYVSTKNLIYLQK